MRREHAILVPLVIVGVILTATLGWLPIMVSAFLGVGIVVAFRVMSPGAARRSVDISVLLLIASAIGVSKAVDQTGLANAVASFVLEVFKPLGVVAVLAAMFVLTNVFTELVTNTAAAAMMFPIALSAADELQYEPRACAVVVAIAASASFSTPIGYQTNMMVYGPGGYRFRDFLVAGLPLNFIAGCVTVIGVHWIWGGI